MRLARYAVGGEPRIGIVTDAGLVDLARHWSDAPGTMPVLLESLDDWRDRLDTAETMAADHALADVRLLTPVERPGKIMAIGLNYADHVAESGLGTPSAQMWFAKMSTAIAGPYDDVPLPKVSEQLDYEAELVAVIGKRCRHVPRDEAAGVIAGYMAGNDFSVRDWQLKTTQFLLGKSFDGHAPVGPWITTADEVDPHDLPIRCLVNGEVRQNSNTSNLIFNVFEMITELSAAMTLEPGDLVFTGTPGGVAAAMDPPRWLVAGDVVRVELGALGYIENCVAPEGA